MKKVDLLDFNKFNKKDNIYYVIIDNGSKYEYHCIGTLTPDEFNYGDFIMKVLRDKPRHYKYMMVKPLDDVYLLNKDEINMVLL